MIYEVEFDHNNSGGVDWVTQEQWQILADNGWYATCGDMPRPYSMAKKFSTRSSMIAEYTAIDEVVSLIGIDPDAEGCSCCGRPFSFSAYEVK